MLADVKSKVFNRRNTAPLGIISSLSTEALPVLAFRDVLTPFFRRRKTGSSGPFSKAESIQDRRALLFQPINILSFVLSVENTFAEAKAELQT